MAFDNEGFDIIGIQEGRVRHDQQVSGIVYEMYIAGADQNGCYGSQLWVRRRGVFTVDSFIPRNHRIVEIVGSLIGIGNKVHVFSVHAPHEADDANTKADFWEVLTSYMLAAQQKGHRTIMLADANSRVGSISSCHFGDEDKEKENANGHLFRFFLQTCSMFAANTWHPIGYTWRSSYGTSHRIDYTCFDELLNALVQRCYIPADIELSRAAKEDHRAVVAVLLLPVQTHDGHQHSQCHHGATSFNVDALKDFRLVTKFEQAMWHFTPSPDASLTDHTEEFSHFIRRSAREVFGPPKRLPIKPWISQRTWVFLQHVGPSRRFMHAARRQASLCYLGMCLYAWATMIPEDFPVRAHMVNRRGLATRVTHGFGWCAKARYDVVRQSFRVWRHAEIAAYQCIVLLQRCMNQHIRDDRKQYYERLAMDAQACARRGDLRGAYGIAKKLGGFRLRPPKAVRLADGSVSMSAEERCDRWQNHFMQVAGGRMVEELRDLESSPQSCVQSTFVASPSKILAANMRLGRNKGLGHDNISAELLCAGGSALAIKQAEICQRIVDQESWAVQWKGGRQVDLYKGKGDALDPDNSRGLLISDHMAKSFVTLLKDEIDPPYTEFMPSSQHGAVEGLGTDYAHHFLLSCIDYAMLMVLSIFVLFVDLTKAFDNVLRELVFGWPSHIRPDRASRIAHLMDCGANEDVASWIYDYLEEHGTAFDQMHIDAKVTSLVRELHTKSWFQYQGCNTYVATMTGGRQGCKLGGIVFNSAYALVLIALRSKLTSSGITLRVKRRDGPFWDTSTPLAHDAEDVVDVAFVDDLCVVLFATSPKQLWCATMALLQVTTELFNFFRLFINWNKGKTEAFMKFRGKQSLSYYDKLRSDAGFGIRLPGTDLFLHVVSSYKHLGSVTDMCGSNYLYSKQRASSAMASYAPIATRIFGNGTLELCLRKCFCESLILSKLLFNAYLRVFKVKEFKVLNSLYMRVVRRIGGNVRFDHTACSDLVARRQVNMLSLDCIILQRRLIYLARLVQSRCHPLQALLSQGTLQKDGSMRQLPWATQIRKDLRSCYSISAIAVSLLPDPDLQPTLWYELMLSGSDTWRNVVLSVRFFESVCDRSRVDAPDCAVASFQCLACPASFGTSKALQQHSRSKHGARTDRRHYAPADGICQSCNKKFSTRLRLIAHWSDSRRPQCWSWIISNGIPLPARLVAELDNADKVQRNEARRNGHSRPLSTGRVVQAD